MLLNLINGNKKISF